MVDIGCGPGHATNIFVDKLKPKKAYGLDFDDGMLSYAKSNYEDKITFVKADLLLDIEEHPNYDDLKDADLVTATCFLHAFPTLDQYMTISKNISKLLAKGKYCAMVNIMWGDYMGSSDFLESEECLEYFDYKGLSDNSAAKLPMFSCQRPNKGEYVQKWEKAFGEAGLELAEISIIHENIDIPIETFSE